MSRKSPRARRLRTIALALLVLFGLACALGRWRTRELVARAEADNPQLGRFVEARGVRLHYVERGKGRPIVLLHGAYGALLDYTATVFDPLARTHHVLAFDRPGHGYSTRDWSEPGVPSAQARQLHAAVEQLGIERPVLVGFSIGGSIALAYALDFPEEVSGLVVINTVTHEWPGRTSVIDHLPRLPLLGDLVIETVFMPLAVKLTRPAVERAFAPERIPLSFSSSPLELALRPANFRANAEDVRLLKAAVAAQSRRYGEIRVPTVILAGEKDEVAHATMHSVPLHAEIAGSELVLIPDAGHQLLYTQPKAVIDAIERVCEMLDARERAAAASSR